MRLIGTITPIIQLMNKVSQESIITLSLFHSQPAAESHQQSFPISQAVWMTDRGCDCLLSPKHSTATHTSAAAHTSRAASSSELQRCINGAVSVRIGPIPHWPRLHVALLCGTTRTSGCSCCSICQQSSCCSERGVEGKWTFDDLRWHPDQI